MRKSPARLPPTIIAFSFALLIFCACGGASGSVEEPLAEPVPEQAGEPSVAATGTNDLQAIDVTAVATPDPAPKVQSAQLSDVAALPPVAADVNRRLSAHLDSYVYRPGDPPQRKAPGAVLLVDLPESRFLKAAGTADLATMQAVEPDDVFEIGSITKLFTAVLLLQLHEEGVLSLDDSLADWLPALTAVISNGGIMTLRQLATHTAGLDDYERDLYPLAQMIADPSLLTRGFAPNEIVAWVGENKTPLFEPGAPGKWQYSNTGYILLGMVLEAATGQSLSELYAQRIFEPLGLESAVLLESVPQEGQIVSGYNAMAGSYADLTRWNASGAWSAGALAMNAADLASAGHALLDGRLFRDRNTLDLMTDFVSTGDRGAFAGYGLGLAQLQDGTWGHAGGTPGFGSGLIVNPTDETVVVFLGNSGSFNVNPMELSSLPEDATAAQK
jgi:D-alanyl-D-alanine carboxypeptidase